MEAARRLAQLVLVDIQPGLSDAELANAEQRFGFEFADDHRVFLGTGLPVRTAGRDNHPDKASWGPTGANSTPPSCTTRSTGRWQQRSVTSSAGSGRPHGVDVHTTRTNEPAKQGDSWLQFPE